MTNPCKVTYVLSGITERTDILEMENGTIEDAIKAIQNKFQGVWGFDPYAIEVSEIVIGHYEEQLFPANDIRSKWFPTMTHKVFVEG